MSDTVVVLQNIPDVISSIDTNTVTTVTSIDKTSAGTISSVESNIVLSETRGEATIISSAIQGPPGPTGTEIILTFSSTSTISEQVLDAFPYTVYGGAKYIIYATIGSIRQICEILLLHNNTSVLIVEYANMITSEVLCTFTSRINGGNVELFITPTNISTNFKLTRTLLPS